MGPQSTRSQSVMGPHPTLQRENSTPRSASMVAPQKVTVMHISNSELFLYEDPDSGSKRAFDWRQWRFPREGGEAGRAASRGVLAHQGKDDDDDFHGD